MPIRIANNRLVMYRGKERVVVASGQKFDFTKDELEQIKKDAPDALRTPINENETAVEAKPKTGANQSASQSHKSGDKDEL